MYLVTRIVFRTLPQELPTFGVPGTAFVENNFSGDWEGGQGFRLTQKHYIYCAFYSYYYYLKIFLRWTIFKIFIELVTILLLVLCFSYLAARPSGPYTCNAGDPSSMPGSGRSAGEGIGYPLQYSSASLVAQLVKNIPTMRKTWV